MGIVERKVLEITCDMCRFPCEADDGDILIYTNTGCKDGGPNRIEGVIKYYEPYGVSGGIICKLCKLKWLLKYTADLEKQYGYPSLPA